MKKNLLLTAVFASLLLLFSCGNVTKNINYAKLKLQIQAVQQELPMNVDGLGKMTSIDLDEDEKVVVYEYLVTDPGIDINILKANQDILKKNMAKALKTDSDAKEMTDECIKCGIGIKVIYKDIKGNKATATITFTELKTYMETDIVETPIEKLQDLAQITKATLPEKVDENTVFTDIYLEGSNYVMEYSFDEAEFDITDIDKKEAKKLIKSNMSEINDSETEEVYELCRKTNVNIMIRYVGAKTKKKLDITIPYTEL